MATARRPRARERRNREEEVVAAAIAIFWKKGYPAASIQDVADEVGVLKGSLYYYIESKEDLLFRIFDESHQQASVIIEETKAIDAPALERLSIYFERYLLWYLENIERVSVYFTEWRHLTGARRNTVRQQRRAYEDFVKDLVAEAQAEGDVPAELDPKHAAYFLLGAVNAVPTWFRRSGPDKPEQIAATYRGMILGALREGTVPPPAAKAKAAPTAKAEPVAKATPAPKAAPAAKAKPTAKAKAAPKPKATAVPKPRAKAAPKPKPTP